MALFSRDDLATLMAAHEGPCVTLCMPTHRRMPEAQQNAIRFGNLLKQATSALEARGKRDAAAGAVTKALEKVAREGDGSGDFWTRQQEGLAVFASPDYTNVFRVPIRVPELAVVADTFNVKPLLPLLLDDLRYHVLGVTQNDVTLYEGNGESLHELDVPGVPRNLVEAIGGEWDDSREAGSFHGTRSGGPASPAGPGGPGPMGHGYGGQGRAGEGDKVELERFMRALARAVEERVSKPTGLPLILAAIDYYHPIYRSVSHDARLADGGILQDPKSLSRDQLHAAALAVFAPERDARLASALEEFGNSKAHGLGSSDLPEVARAAAAGRVRRIILDAGRVAWGRMDRTTGELTTSGKPGSPGDTDLLDELAEVVISKGGEVLMTESSRMPVPTGVAAIYRY